MLRAMDEPEFIRCVNCETPCYTFEWVNDEITEAFCTACGTEDPEEFMTDEDFDALESG